MNPHLQAETQALIRSWAAYDPAWLRDYLVSGVEDPRVNLQSILGRHFLIDMAFPGRCAQLQKEEARFAAVVAWLRRVVDSPGGEENLHGLAESLRRGADNLEGLLIPAIVSQAFRELPAIVDGLSIPNYLDCGDAEACRRLATEPDLFLGLWREALGAIPPAGIRLLEPACGSANDFRFLDRCGLARHLDYTGIDLCAANIANALQMFPATRFLEGNLLELPFPGEAFDACLVHDLFEHLSLEALEIALDEICRVTRRALCLGFFRVHEGPEHILNPVDDYHANLLSLPRLREALEKRGFTSCWVHLATYSREELRRASYHNSNAYTAIAERAPGTF